MHNPLGVGIIGANARGGWASEAHVPAVRALAGLELAAVATNSQETADEAAHALGVDKSYASGRALIADDSIDVVTVATRVPDHLSLVMAALAAGKHVYSEWPLGRGSQESDDMARAAKSAGVHHTVGLQLRASPAVSTARDRLAAGGIGRILSLSAFSSSAGFGPSVGAQFAYLEDPSAFANLVTIQGAHTLDLMMALGGALAGISALASRQFPDIVVGNEGEWRRRQTFDHLSAQGHLVQGAPYTVEVAGGRTRETPFWLEIVGESGTLRLDGGAPRGPQAGRIGLIENGSRIVVDEGPLANLPDAAVNVAGAYATLRDDILNGTTNSPGFDHASMLTRLVEAALESSKTGRTVLVDKVQK